MAYELGRLVSCVIYYRFYVCCRILLTATHLWPSPLPFSCLQAYHPFSPYDETENRCVDCTDSVEGDCEDHRMSPVALYRNITQTNECIDRHRMKHRAGECRFENMDFRILPHVLRVYLPKLKCGRQHPTIDFSRG